MKYGTFVKVPDVWHRESRKNNEGLSNFSFPRELTNQQLGRILDFLVEMEFITPINLPVRIFVSQCTHEARRCKILTIINWKSLSFTTCIALPHWQVVGNISQLRTKQSIHTTCIKQYGRPRQFPAITPRVQTFSEHSLDFSFHERCPNVSSRYIAAMFSGQEQKKKNKQKENNTCLTSSLLFWFLKNLKITGFPSRVASAALPAPWGRISPKLPVFIITQLKWNAFILYLFPFWLVDDVSQWPLLAPEMRPCLKLLYDCSILVFPMPPSTKWILNLLDGLS